MTLVETEYRNGAVWLWLNRPERHNALVPDLISELRTSIAAAARELPTALVLSGRGASFSTGGDIGGFLAHAASGEDLTAYAAELVSALHEAVLDLLKLPVPVLAAVNGPVTGGSTGLVLAADLVVLSESAFVQPYYSEVGFGPDGGWTALLADRIGTAKTLQILYLNERICADEALKLGLAASIRPAAELPAQIDDWVDSLQLGFSQTHSATRKSVWDDRRLEMARGRLVQEKQRFLDLIARPETLDGMRNFTRTRA